MYMYMYMYMCVYICIYIYTHTYTYNKSYYMILFNYVVIINSYYIRIVAIVI